MIYALKYIELKMVKTDQLREKINIEGFHENGCYGNQAQPLEVLFDSIEDNNSFLSYFFVKKIPLSRRVEYVMDGSMDHSVSELVSE